jgi:hypothetical protein
MDSTKHHYQSIPSFRILELRLTCNVQPASSAQYSYAVAVHPRIVRLSKLQLSSNLSTTFTSAAIHVFSSRSGFRHVKGSSCGIYKRELIPSSHPCREYLFRLRSADPVLQLQQIEHIVAPYIPGLAITSKSPELSFYGDNINSRQ